MMNNLNATVLLEQITGSLPYFLPEIVCSLVFIVAIFIDLFTRKQSRSLVPFFVFAGLLLALFFTLDQFRMVKEEIWLFNGMIRLSPAGIIYKLLFLLAAMVTHILSIRSKAIRLAPKGYAEFFIMLPVFIVGLNIMSMSSHLLMIFLGMEMVSIASYILVAYMAEQPRSAEAAVKYALFGALSSAVMLYGISLLYGLTGTLSLQGSTFLANLSKAPEYISALAILMVLAGFLYKISAVPFHFYVPDVYEGTPAPVIAFLSTAPKAAGFAVLFTFIGVFTLPMESYHLVWPKFNWENILVFISICTMTLGNLSALAQKNVKRMMAYSSIAHTGFMMMPLLVFSEMSAASLVFYIVVYVLMNLAIFLLVGHMEDAYGATELESYKGLAAFNPLLSVCMVIVLASLVGLPPTGGFTGKFLVFSSVLEAYRISHNPWLLYLLVAAVLNTVIALFFYLRLPLYMYFRKAEKIYTSKTPLYLLVIMCLLVAGILMAGVFPSELVKWISAHTAETAQIRFK